MIVNSSQHNDVVAHLALDPPRIASNVEGFQPKILKANPLSGQDLLSATAPTLRVILVWFSYVPNVLFFHLRINAKID